MSDSIIQGAVALLVLLGCFGLLVPGVIAGKAPDPTVVAFVSPIAGLVVGWYFTSRSTTAGANIANAAAAVTPTPAPPK